MTNPSYSGLIPNLNQISQVPTHNRYRQIQNQNQYDSNSTGLYYNFETSPMPQSSPIPQGSPHEQRTYKKGPSDLNKVFIGGLSYNTSEETLKNYFSKFGTLIDHVIIKNPQTKTSKGFGFVQYSEPDMVDELMRNRPHSIDNRKLDVRRSIPRNKIRNKDQNRMVEKLFVGGLVHDKISEENLREYFEKFGNVKNIYIPKNKETSKLKNFGFITFDDYDSVDKITLNDSVIINNVHLTVSKADNPERKTNQTQRNQDGSFWSQQRFNRSPNLNNAQWNQYETSPNQFNLHQGQYAIPQNQSYFLPNQNMQRMQSHSRNIPLSHQNFGPIQNKWRFFNKKQKPY